MLNFFKNYFSTIIFIILIYLFYSNNYYYNWFLNWTYTFNFYQNISINIKDAYKYIIYFYIIILIPFYFFSNTKSKARIVINYIFKKIKIKNYSITPEEKTALLAWIVKWFFAPLMIFWLIWHIFSIWNNIHSSISNIDLFSKEFLLFFNKYFFYTFFSIILFLDVLFFTLGYLIEWNFFKNTIKSVEPTILWWLVCIICYPPFNSNLNNIIWWYSTDFPQFNLFYIHIFMNISILVLMWIYSRASMSLGFKASNLTNRWIVVSWPYKYVRHPAYITKNLAWWIGGLPVIILSIINFELWKLIIVFISLSAWSYIYYLRAKTEENHLSLTDKKYIDYKLKVKNMFIPFIK